MNGWSPKEIKLGTVSAVGAGVTNQVITDPATITAGGSKFIVFAIKASAVTLTTAITVKLQTGINGDFVDSKTASIVANGTVFLRLNNEVAADQQYIPLLASARLVVTTGTGDAVTFDSISVLQEL
jgi:hypothetical protein